MKEAYLFLKLAIRTRSTFLDRKSISGRWWCVEEGCCSCCLNCWLEWRELEMFLFAFSVTVDAEVTRSSVEKTNRKINRSKWKRTNSSHLRLISFSVKGTPKSRFKALIISMVGKRLYRADALNVCTWTNWRRREQWERSFQWERERRTWCNLSNASNVSFGSTSRTKINGWETISRSVRHSFTWVRSTPNLM